MKLRDEERARREREIIINIKIQVLPYLEKLRTTTDDESTTAYVDSIECTLDNICSGFSHRLISDTYGLTPTETQIADLIRRGKASKEIAEFLKVSIDSVHFHRNNIRKKLNLTNTKANLTAYLSSFSER